MKKLIPVILLALGLSSCAVKTVSRTELLTPTLATAMNTSELTDMKYYGSDTEYDYFVRGYSRYRVRTVSMRLLRFHAWYCKALAEAFAIRADGDIDGGFEAYVNFYREFGRYEAEIERYFDQYLAFSAFKRAMFRKPENKPVATEQL